MSEQVGPAPKAYQANVFWDRQDCATLSAQVYLARLKEDKAEAKALRNAERKRWTEAQKHLL